MPDFFDHLMPTNGVEDARVPAVLARVDAAESRITALYPIHDGTPMLTQGEPDELTASRADLGEYATWEWTAVVRTGAYIGQISTARYTAAGVSGLVSVFPFGPSSVIDWKVDGSNRVCVVNSGVEDCQIEYWGIRIR